MGRGHVNGYKCRQDAARDRWEPACHDRMQLGRGQVPDVWANDERGLCQPQKDISGGNHGLASSRTYSYLKSDHFYFQFLTEFILVSMGLEGAITRSNRWHNDNCVPGEPSQLFQWSIASHLDRRTWRAWSWRSRGRSTTWRWRPCSSSGSCWWLRWPRRQPRSCWGRI